jgi:hypothetical protein
MLEAGGTSARDALLASAGIRAGEIEALRALARQSEEAHGQTQAREAELQRRLDQAKTTIAQRDKELKDVRQILSKTAETEKSGHQLIEAFDRQVTELQAAMAAYEETLARTISTDGLGWASMRWRHSAYSKIGWPAEKASRTRRWVPLAIAGSI